MDPNETLKEIRRLITRWDLNQGFSADDADQFTELVDAMDGWLSRGGFLPTSWERK